MVNLPVEYKVPTNHNPADTRSFGDSGLLLFHPARSKVIVERESGTLEIKRREDIPLLFQNKFNWTFSKLKEWEAFFKFFNRDQLFELKLRGFLSFGDYVLNWIPGTGKMRLTKDNNTHTSKYLINIYSWVDKGVNVFSLDQLKGLVDKIIWMNNYIPINITSPASTAKDLLLTGRKAEFSLFNLLPLEDTKFLHSCYIGPRMESRCLGTIEDLDNLDLEKAYLRALGECPSLSPHNVLKVERNAPFSEDAHPGSGYEIEVDIPRYYSEFLPIPFRNSGSIFYPYGKFTTRVSKPYIDLLNQRGDISYKILSSVQVILQKKKYPFKEFSNLVELFENTCEESLWPINLKNLHYSIHGHMLHIHKNWEDWGWWYEASQDYNPIDACAVQGMVACALWRFSSQTRTEAIRVDALSGYSIPDREGFRRESSGLMTFLTPILKDKPKSSRYRDLITKYRDHPMVKVTFPLRRGVSDSWTVPWRIGHEEKTTLLITPTGGGRQIDKPKKVGELLDRRISLNPTSSLNTPAPKESDGLGWVEEYLNLFPQDGGSANV